MQDEELIERCKSGDTGAFDLLVERYAGTAYQVAYSVLKNREDAEEAAQDAFIRANRSLKNFRGECAFKTWLYRIVMNVARNKYRWNNVRQKNAHVSLDETIENDDNSPKKVVELADNRSVPDREAITRETVLDIQNAMDKLPDEYRQALILRNVEDMSYEDMAEAMNCKIGTVKSRLARAREAMKQLLYGVLSPHLA